MKIYDWQKYRIEGLITVVLYKDDNPRKFIYKIVEGDYEEKLEFQKKNPNLAHEENIKILSEIQVKSYLKVKHKFDFGHSWHTLFDLIYNFGGVNMNPNTKGYLAFIPLERDNQDGIDWSIHEKEVMPSVMIPRRKR